MATQSNYEIGVGIVADKALATLKSLSKETTQFWRILKRTTAVLVAFKISNATIRGIAKLTKTLVITNATFERAEKQLKTFLGTSELAGREMDFLSFKSTQLAGGLEDLIKASTALSTFGLKSAEWLDLVADTAQATGRSVDDVAIAFGRIASGDQRTKQFLTTRRGDLEVFNRVMKETGSATKALRASFQKFRGVSKEMEGTFFRLAENMGDFLFIAAKISGEPIFNLTKSVLKKFVDWLHNEVFDENNRVKEEGTIFHTVANSMDAVIEKSKLLVDILLKIDSLLFTIPVDIIKGKPSGGTLFGHVSTIAGYIEDIVYAPAKLMSGQRNKLAEDIWSFVRPDQGAAKMPKEIRDEIAKRQEAALDAWKRWKGSAVARSDLQDSLMPGGNLFISRQKLLEGDRFHEVTGLDEESRELEAFADHIEMVMKADVEQIENRAKNAQWLSDFIVDLEKDTQDAILSAQKEGARKYAELTRKRLNDMGRLYDRLFGKFDIFTNPNESIDRQVASLKEELDVLNGMEAPLTRQEELQNRILEIEARRVGLTDRLQIGLKGIVNELANAAVKAAVLNGILNALGHGGGTGGFFGIFKSLLNLAAIIPGPQQPFVAGTAVGVNLASPGVRGAVNDAGIGGSAGGPVGIRPGGKPAFMGSSNGNSVYIMNPTFVGSDAVNLVEEATTLAGRRVFNG